jgi:hypothetical protein
LHRIPNKEISELHAGSGVFRTKKLNMRDHSFDVVPEYLFGKILLRADTIPNVKERRVKLNQALANSLLVVGDGELRQRQAFISNRQLI